MPNYKLDTDTQVFFYEQEFYPLSNFSSFMMFWKGQWFQTSEHVYHWEKFEEQYVDSFEVKEMKEAVRDALLESNSAHTAFGIAQEHKYLARPDWNDVKFPIMKRIITTKAIQHPYVMKKLMASGDREVIEDSWRDDVWGWGPKHDGKNMLGKLWMEVRTELREKGFK